MAVIAYDYLVDINEMLIQEYQSQALDKAERYGLRLEDLVRDIENRFINLAQASLINNKRRIDEGLKELAETHAAYTGSWSVVQNGESWAAEKTYGSPDLKFETIKKYLNRINKSGDAAVQLMAVGKRKVSLVRKFKIHNSQKILWIIGLFNSSLLKSLTVNEEDSKTYMIDAFGRELFTSKQYRKLFQQESVGEKIIKQMNSELGASFIRDLKDRQNQDINISFYQIPGYRITLAFHIKSRNLQDSIGGILRKVGLKVALIVLFSMFFAYLLSNAFTKNLGEVYKGTVRIANGNFEEEVKVKSRDEIGVLAASVNYMSKMIRDLLESVKDGVRLEQELETAQTVQNTFFQDNYIECYPFRLASFYTPASECGGDWWGHFNLSPGVDLVVVGDATGHGVPAALITAMAYATTNTFVKGMIDSGDRKPSALLAEINSVLFNSLEGKMCMTFVAMIFDSKAGKIIYSNGGHVFPFLIPKSTEDERIKSGRIRKLKIPATSLVGGKGSSILGIAADTEFNDNEVDLKVGDKFILYTDGITEAVNDSGKMMGSRGFVKIIQGAENPDCLAIRDVIITGTKEFNKNTDVFDDDLTLVIVEYGDVSLEGIA